MKSQLRHKQQLTDYIFIVNAIERENNILDMKKEVIDMIDKGYCNYERFASFCRQGNLFFTRLKHNAKSKLEPEDESIVFSGKPDEEKCPYKLRRVKSVCENTGKPIVILTNDFSVSTEYVAKLYRAR